MQQVQALHYLLELTKELAYLVVRLAATLGCHYVMYHLLMTLQHSIGLGLILTLALGSHPGRSNKLVSDSAQRRNHYYHIILL